MNLNLFSQFLLAIGERILAKETPYSLELAKALVDYSLVCVDILTSSVPPDQKKKLWMDAHDNFKTIIASLEQQGAEILNDILELITQAASDEVMGIFGFDKNSASVNG